jgi:hypothetical protein
MRFVEPPDAIPHRERNNTYHRISKRTLHLVLLSKEGDFKLNSKPRVVPNSEHSFLRGDTVRYWCGLVC